MEQAKPRPTRWQVPFFAIWTGQQLSLIGSTIAQFALVWWLTKTTGSATVLATASILELLPTIGVAPFAGALIDRWNRRWVMIVADSLLALAALWLAYLFWADALQIWHVYVILFARAVLGNFHWPAMETSTVLMVPKEHLSRVAGLNVTMWGALNMTGPALGALFMELLPLHGIMLVDVGPAALAVVPLLFVMIPQPARAAAAAGESFGQSMRAGLRYIRGWPGLMALTFGLMINKILVTPALSFLPLLVSEHFQGSAAQLGLLEATVGIGVVVGGLVFSAWGGFKRRIMTLLVGALIEGLFLAGLGMTPADMFVVAVVCNLIRGLMIPMVDVTIKAIMQGTVAPEMQGRVFTVVSSLIYATGPLGLAIGGPMGDLLGVRSLYVAAGFVCAALSVLGFFVPALVNIEENCNVPAAVEAPAEDLGAA